jgi:anti-sigma factor RsiW
MSHLGDRISALIDGELVGAELDRANAHLASCEKCRGEATALRALKRELHALAEAPPAEAAAIRRLIAVAGPGGPMPSRRRVRSGKPGRGWSPKRTPSRRRPRRAYAVAGAVGIAVVGIGAAAFTVGGGSEIPEPKITPNMQMYVNEHAITTGDVPLPEPTGGGTASSEP